MTDNNSVKSSTGTCPNDKDKILDKITFLWEEYKYRHDLCWKLIFQITAGVVIILIIPYTKTEIAKEIKYWVVCLPLIAIGLLIFSFMRMDSELKLLHLVRTEYRKLQTSLYDISHDPDDQKFNRDVKWSLIALVLLCIADIIALSFFWIPKLPQ